MAEILTPKQIPVPLSHIGRARNGLEPDWRTPYNVAKRMNYTTARLRKMVFVKHAPFSTVPQGSAGGAVTQWRFKCHTGDASETPGSLQLRAEVLAVPGDVNPTTPDPAWQFVAGATTSTQRHVAYSDTTFVPALDDLQIQSVLVDVNGDTEYDCEFQVLDGCRLVSATVWEQHKTTVDTADTVTVDSREFADGNDITDAQHSELQETGHLLWRHNGAHLFNLNPDSIQNGDFNTTSASYVNVLGGSTTVSSTSRGWTLATQYLNPLHTDNIVCVFAVYGYTTGNVTRSVKLEDASGTLADITTLPVGAGSAAWVSATANLDGSAGTHKVDVHYKSDGSQTLHVEAVSLYTYVA